MRTYSYGPAFTAHYFSLPLFLSFTEVSKYNAMKIIVSFLVLIKLRVSLFLHYICLCFLFL